MKELQWGGSSGDTEQTTGLRCGKDIELTSLENLPYIQEDEQ